MSSFRPWRLPGWKHWAWATAVPILIAITLPLQSFHSNWHWAHWRILFSAPWFLFFSYTVLIAITVAESNVPAEAKTPAWRYFVALLAASAIYVAALGAFPEWVRSPPRQVTAGQVIFPESNYSADMQARARRINVMLKAPAHIACAWVATFVYVWLRSSRRAARVLADAEVERAQAQRDLLAAQLVAAHAQVDPAFVLKRLEEVERAYEEDAARGDVLLDDFITFLRDAIPRLRAEERPVAASLAQGAQAA